MVLLITSLSPLLFYSGVRLHLLYLLSGCVAIISIWKEKGPGVSVLGHGGVDEIPFLHHVTMGIFHARYAKVFSRLAFSLFTRSFVVMTPFWRTRFW